MLCCWIEEPNSEAFKLHLPRVSDYLWVAEDGMKMQVWKINKIIYSIFLHFLASFFNLSPTYLNNSCAQLFESIFHFSDFLVLFFQGYNGSQLWDTAFTVQAIISTNLSEEFGPTLKKAHEYVKNTQV